MRTAILDLETSGFNANSSIILCGVIKVYGANGIKVIRADKYANWKTNRSNNACVVKDIIKELREYDIIVAHNGRDFDKAFLTSLCVKYDIEPILRYKKLVDPCLASRRYLRIGRNSLASLIDHLDIPERKTPIEFKHWLQAALDGNTKSMDIIVKHCIADVKSLEMVYDKLRPLIDKIDTKGSAS
jgi:uncharacterized protein YprB with RNaseH-like and TPR domain